MDAQAALDMTWPEWEGAMDSGVSKPEWEQAKLEIVLELMQRAHISGRIVNVSDMTIFHTPGNRICPNQSLVRKRAQIMIERCDRRFRCSNPGHRIEFPKDPWCDQGHHPPCTMHFESARFCFVSHETQNDDRPFDFDTPINLLEFTEILLGYPIASDAYGKHGRVVEFAVEACDAFRLAENATARIVNVLKERQYLGTPAVVVDEADALEKLNRSLISCGDPYTESFVAQMRHGIVTRFKLLNRATEKVRHLCSVVREHCRERAASGKSHIMHLPDDCWDPLALFLDHIPSVANLMQTCTRFAKMSCLCSRLPSPIPRTIIGCFPHMQRISRDRTDLAAGVVRPVFRNFVLARKAVRLYVDFCTTELRPVPLKKMDRSDGLDNKDHDFSDDEFEDPPETLTRRGPYWHSLSHDPNPESDWGRHVRRHEQKERGIWLTHEGPQEPANRRTYKKRANYEQYLVDTPNIVASLVFADDKTPVPDSVNPGGLALSNQMRKADRIFKQPTAIKHVSAQFVPGNGPHDCLPAFAKFHITNLSMAHGGRLFCIKLETTGTFSANRGGKVAKWITFTEPFEVVSKIEVVHNTRSRTVPTKRKPTAAIRRSMSADSKRPCATCDTNTATAPIAPTQNGPE
tara:strand:+ start:5105 stop:7000 length:1896 start_codon:yes stop_codon:yes gene_type:complete